LGVGGLVAYFILSEPGRLAEDVGASVYQLKTGEDVSLITIDGRIETGEWERFRWFEASSGLAVYITNDDEYLYIAIDDRENTNDDGMIEHTRIAFLPPGETAQIEAGKFKSIYICGDGIVLWEDWGEVTGLAIKGWRTQRTNGGMKTSDELIERMDELTKANQSTMFYDDSNIIGGINEEEPYVAIADNISNIPEGLVGKTSFDTNRIYEAKVPLSIIDMGADQTIRVCGHTFIEPPGENRNYPNVRMGRLVNEIGQIKIPRPIDEERPSQEPANEAPPSERTPIPVPSPAPVLTGDEVELKYDDGTSDGSCSAGYEGFSTRFSTPATPFTISKIKVFTNLRGAGYEERKPQLEILDKDFNTLLTHKISYAGISTEPAWVTVEIPELTVNNDFYVVFYTNSKREGGIYIHYDLSGPNTHSEMTDGSRITEWIWERMPKEKTNWMIRVIGNSTDESKPSMSTPTSALPPTSTQMQPLLEYIVTVNDPENHLAHVTLTMSNFDEKQISLRVRPIAETTVDYDKPFIKEVTIAGGQGRIVSGPSFEGGEWLVVVDTEGVNNLTIDYKVEQLLLDPHGAYESYIGEDFAVIVPNTLLLYPKSSEVKGTIHFIGPDGWSVSSVWEEIETDIFSFEGTEELDNFVAFGPFSMHAEEIDELKVTLSVFEGVESQVDPDESFQVIEDLTHYYSQAFKPLDKEELHWIVVSDPVTGGGVRDKSFLVSAVRMENFWGIFAHEYVHLWNGTGVGIDPVWFREGATEFLAYRGLVDIGTISEDARKEILLRDWQIYLDLIANGEDKAVSSAPRPDPDINYRKGHLVNYTLDLTIQDITKGERDFLDVTRYLAANYWGTRLSNDDILQAVNQVTGTDFSDFFSKYVYGTEKLPLTIVDGMLALEK